MIERISETNYPEGGYLMMMTVNELVDAVNAQQAQLNDLKVANMANPETVSGFDRSDHRADATAYAIRMMQEPSQLDRIENLLERIAGVLDGDAFDKTIEKATPALEPLAEKARDTMTASEVNLSREPQPATGFQKIGTLQPARMTDEEVLELLHDAERHFRSVSYTDFERSFSSLINQLRADMEAPKVVGFAENYLGSSAWICVEVGEEAVRELHGKRVELRVIE